MIANESIVYRIVRHYGCWLHRACSAQYQVIGRENIPTDGAIILAPNHTCALQDAITSVDAMQRGVVFVGRAAMFKKPVLASICRFFKIMPIGRMRDGLSEVRQNDKTFNEAVRVLQAGTPFAIFAEGTMRSKHSLLPLVKGIFRIALQANDELNSEATTKDSISREAANSAIAKDSISSKTANSAIAKDSISTPVYILPMGIDYDDYFHFGDRTRVEIGHPINVTAFVAEHPEMTRPQLINALQAELTSRIKPLFRYLPDDDTYPSQHKRFFASRPIDHPAIRWAALVLGLPFFVLSALVCWPSALMELYVHFGITDHGFDRTFRYIVGFTLGIFTLGIYLIFWLFVIYYLNNARRLFGYQPGYQELMP